MSSSRRTSGEIHILAMLDGKPTASLPRRFLALPAAVWYAAAGVLACGLLATLAWLVHAPPRERAADADGDIYATHTRAATGSVSAHPTVMTPAPDDLAANNPALVVTEVANLPDPVIPMPATPPTGTHTAPAARVTPMAAQADRTAQYLSGTATGSLHHEPPAPPPRGPVSREARGATPIPAGVHPSTPHAAVPGQGMTGARSAAPPPRAKRPPGARTAPPAAVDTDVALISAIIQHTIQQQVPQQSQQQTQSDDQQQAGTRMPNRQ